MNTKITSDSQQTVLDELIENAIDLPVESQNFLLTLAKEMIAAQNDLPKQKEKSYIA